jgi:hypothetical protein
MEPNKRIVITVINGKVTYVDEWDDEETKHLYPMEVYFGHPLREGIDYGVFYHEDLPEEKTRQS